MGHPPLVGDTGVESEVLISRHLDSKARQGAMPGIRPSPGLAASSAAGQMTETCTPGQRLGLVVSRGGLVLW